VDGPEEQCPSCGAALSRPLSRYCPACGATIERRSADRPPPSVWRWRRIGLILGAVVGAVVIGGGVALLAGQGTPWGMGPLVDDEPVTAVHAPEVDAPTPRGASA
jgi:predicted RNA-binding Zn-ribbon protein involved in translation (DUF1610 family)